MRVKIEPPHPRYSILLRSRHHVLNYAFENESLENWNPEKELTYIGYTQHALYNYATVSLVCDTHAIACSFKRFVHLCNEWIVRWYLIPGEMSGQRRQWYHSFVLFFFLCSYLLLTNFSCICIYDMHPARGTAINILLMLQFFRML